MSHEHPVIRESFTVQLKSGRVEEWTARHKKIWPELLLEQTRCGFLSMSIFVSGSTLFVYSEVMDIGAWERLVNSDIHKKWVEFMRDLSESALPDSTVQRSSLREVLHLDFDPINENELETRPVQS